jgi:PAS domain S-box-containing protein
MSLVVSEMSSPEKKPVASDTLRVLYVDDETVLLNICKIQLERRGISVTTAGSVREAFAILESTGFDVILSDYQMPVTDGIEFLKILQERECTIPFILFTGKGREEVVIEAIDNGAACYLQKGGDPKSLFAELEHKVKEASRRHKAEEALKETKLRYDILFENTGTAIILLDDDMVISSANTVFCRMTGHDKNEIEGNLRWTDFVPHEDVSNLIEQYRLLWQGSHPSMHQIAIRLVTKDCRIRVVSATITMIPDTRWCIASLIDITAIAFSEEIPVRKRVDPSPPQNGNPQTNVSRKQFLPMMTQGQQMSDICGSDRLFYD